MSASTHKKATLVQALLPILVLIMLLFSSVMLFGDGSSGGPNQIVLILSACLAALIGIKNGYSWKELEHAMVQGISLSMGALFILLAVGALIGTWILCGTVPVMIYYGLQLLHPSIFYVATCLICAVVAISTGSSWTTAGTIGVALVGIASVLELNLGITAGAIISGAYFGDKLSPLSDTTNLAPAMAGTDLFTHIRHMLWTTIPSLAIASTLFLILGFFSSKNSQEVDLAEILSTLENSFNLGWYLLVPPALVVFMVFKRVPAFPALFIGALTGGLFAVIFQQDVIAKSIEMPALYTSVHGFLMTFTQGHFSELMDGLVSALLPLLASIKACWIALFDGFTAQTGNASLDNLLSRGGMSSMLSTIWLILSAMMFGAILEKIGMLEIIAAHILRLAKSTGSLVAATLATALGMNIIASDQYIAIVLPGRMFRAEFLNRGLHPKNLSRCLEDAGTLTSPLVPWNTCGAYMASTLGVATFAYLPYCFFNLMNPVISAIYGFTGFSIEKLDAEEPAQQEAEKS